MKTIIFSLIFSLSAIANEPLITIEYDVKERALSTDIVLVVDNSASMTSHQETLSKLSSVFLGELKDINYKIIGLSTDTDEAPYGIVEASSVDPTSSFSNLMKSFGSNGSADEMAFESFMNFFHSPVSSSFFRKEASKEIIILGDEDDHSDIETVNVKQFMHAQEFTVNAITRLSDNRTDCGDRWGRSAERLMDVAADTSGVLINICENFSSMQSEYIRLAQAIANRAKHSGYNLLPVKILKLDSAADLDSIEVFYGTQIIKRGLQSTGWIVDEVNNSILFGNNVQLMPQAEGTKFTIKYAIL